MASKSQAPQRRRMMLDVDRRATFSVSVWKCSATDCGRTGAPLRVHILRFY